MSEIFYNLLEMMEQGATDQEIADELGFSIDAIAVWRADAGLLDGLPATEPEYEYHARDDIYARAVQEFDDEVFPVIVEEERYDYSDF
jgi:hypothetical protein